MNTSRFTNKVILVTGGNSGIGLSVATRLVSEGATVILTGRNRDTLNQAVTALGERAHGIVADITRVSEIERLYQQIGAKFGHLDGLFANAGIAIMEPLEAVTEEHVDALMDANIKGTFFTLQKSIPLLTKGAAIVINASVSDTKGSPFSSVYSATKAAVRSMARTFSGGLIERGVRVNAVSPGPIETPIWDGFDPKRIEAMKQANPLKRYGKPEEVTGAVVFLLSDESTYIVGAELYVDGGLSQL